MNFGNSIILLPLITSISININNLTYQFYGILLFPIQFPIHSLDSIDSHILLPCELIEYRLITLLNPFQIS